MHTIFLYFALASLPSMLTAKAPATRWEWWLWAGTALYQGLLAVKAYQSNSKGSKGQEPQPDMGPQLDPPREIRVQNEGGTSTTTITPTSGGPVEVPVEKK